MKFFTHEDILRQIPTHTFKDENGVVHEFKGWLGSGIYSKDGKEIFEGDIIKSENWQNRHGQDRLYIFWEDGAIQIADYDDPEGRDLHNEFETVTLWHYLDTSCEIVGHVSTEPPSYSDEDEDNDND